MSWSLKSSFGCTDDETFGEKETVCIAVGETKMMSTVRLFAECVPYNASMFLHPVDGQFLKKWTQMCFIFSKFNCHMLRGRMPSSIGNRYES